MGMSLLRAGIVGLALVAAAGAAGAESKKKGVVNDIPDVVIQDPALRDTEIRQFLAGGRDLSRLKLPRLQQRLHRAEDFRSMPGLPPDLDQALGQEVARVAEEITRREQGAATAQQAEPGTTAVTEPQLEQPPLPPFDPQQAEPGTAAVGSLAAADFLERVRPAADLDDARLRKQLKQAQALAQQQDLTAEQRRALRNVINEARGTLAARQDQAQQGTTGSGGAGTPGTPGEAPAAGNKPGTVGQGSQATGNKPGIVGQDSQATGNKPGIVKPDQQPGAPAPKVNPVLEQQALAYLNDTTDVRDMKRKQLRKRLAAMRDLLASNQLSPRTREALRQRLAADRAVLRGEVAADEGMAPEQPAQAGGTTQAPGAAGGGTVELRPALQDRRPPSDLSDRELVRRIDASRAAVADDRYSAEQRMMWRRQLEEDRRYLRRQMMAERQQREARLRQGDYQFQRDVQDRYQQGYDVPDDVFAAEADDEEIADVLVAPPRRQLERRYSLDDIERSPDLRDAVARIEIDTVHFGFGEGYLREEEIDKLDRIAQVLEKILARHPDEIFLIEGHTDAVGSDAANLALSRERARAVKEALITYYVIPPENLQTVGLGERYLKIPTSLPEAENRRVSLARITPLVGRAD